MGIYFVDRTKRLSGHQKWKDYKEFRNQVEGDGLINKFWGALLIDKDNRETFRQIHPKVGFLYDGLEQMIEEEKIDTTLWAFQADAIVYKGFEDTPNAELKYHLGVDLCIMDEDDWEIARNLARSRGITLTSWRFYHGSFVRDVKELENPKEILDTVLDFSKVHNKVASALTTGYFLKELYQRGIIS